MLLTASPGEEKRMFPFTMNFVSKAERRLESQEDGKNPKNSLDVYDYKRETKHANRLQGEPDRNRNLA
jgi:hypothetical protein